MIKATNLKIEYSKLIFQNVTFKLGNKEKVGLVGLNGCGKSTLLKILVGLEPQDEGTVELVNEKIAYLPQEYSFEKDLLIGEVLESLVENQHEIYKVNKVLGKLKFEPDWYQTVDTLSHGQKMKLYLAKLLVQSPTILLLDEPTNHLDIEGILWLEEFIKNFDGICIIISHDRAFLNTVTNKIFEIDEQKLNIFEGNYDDYLEQKHDAIAAQRTQFILQERRRQKFEQMITNIKSGAGGEKQSRALKAARKRMDREVLSNEIDLYKESKISDFNISGQNHKTKLIIKVKDLDFGYGKGSHLFEKANFEMYGKEKIWFYGANGIGKSTLVKLIVGELQPTSGTVKIGDNLKYTYFAQDQKHVNYDQTVEEFFLKNTDVSYSGSFGILEKFLFTKDMRNKKIAKLSPGQRARLTFAVFAQKEYDFMILDEPTNHLDIKSKEVIETALREYQGAFLLISHDRYFVESIGVDRAITIENNKIV